MNPDSSIPGSFRDPSGFLYVRNGKLYRQVNNSYKAHYERLMESGLCRELVDKGLLVSHRQVDVAPAEPETAFRIIEPDVIPFISYPYEWCFDQLRDAGLATLAVQRAALDKRMVLKDASAYNIQFLGNQPVLIDTLSFQEYVEGQPWIAYRQFCQHFLAPLSLMSCRDARLGQLSRIHMDGVPLDLASHLLPLRSRIRLPLMIHIHLHAKAQRRYQSQTALLPARRMSLRAMLGLIDNLESAVRRLRWKSTGTEWSEYYQDTNYTNRAFSHKQDIVRRFIQTTEPKVVWDLGANTGVFSRIAAGAGAKVISFDGDFEAVESNYLQCRRQGEKNILPLLVDLTNPSPGIGWENKERMALAERGPADAVLALAIIHHLAIGNNLPFSRIARFLHSLCRTLIIEFVPKDDSQVQRLLATREDIFPNYGEESFQKEFSRYFDIANSEKITDSGRLIYLMSKRV